MLSPNSSGGPKLDVENIMGTVYKSTQKLFAETEGTLLVGLDFTGLEKKYSQKLEGLSQVHGKEGIVNGYPMLTAIVGTSGKRGIIYNKLFSYEIDFKSENTEINLAVDSVGSSFPGRKLRWVADRGFDDVKKFEKLAENNNEFVVRVYHDRKLKVEGKEIKLSKLTEQLQLVGELKSELTIQKRKRAVKVILFTGEFELEGKKYWLERAVVVGHNLEWLLITNVDLSQPENARGIWISYRQRWSIEDFFNFSKGTFNLEKFMVRSFNGIKVMAALLMVALSFIHKEFYYDDEEPLALWILHVGGWSGPRHPKGKRIFSRGIENMLIYYAVAEELAANNIDPEEVKRWLGVNFSCKRPNQSKRHLMKYKLFS